MSKMVKNPKISKNFIFFFFFFFCSKKKLLKTILSQFQSSPFQISGGYPERDRGGGWRRMEEILVSNIGYLDLEVFFLSLFLSLGNYKYTSLRFSNINMSHIGPWRQGREERAGLWEISVSSCIPPIHPYQIPKAPKYCIKTRTVLFVSEGEFAIIIAS